MNRQTGCAKEWQWRNRQENCAFTSIPSHQTKHWIEDTLVRAYATKVNLASAFWHLELDETSSYLTPFDKRYDDCLWRWLLFGLKESSVNFQKSILQSVDDLPEVLRILEKKAQEQRKILFFLPIACLGWNYANAIHVDILQNIGQIPCSYFHRHG